MANVAHAYNVKNFVLGPATVFFNVQVPPSAVPPVQGTNTWAATGTYSIDANGQPADSGVLGVQIGLTTGPATVHMTPKFIDIRADQYAEPVSAAFATLETEIDFTADEFLLSNLQQYFTSLLGTYTNVTSGGNPACDFFQFGSCPSTHVNFVSILFVSPDHVTVGKYWVVNAYKCYLKSAIQSTFKRDTVNQWKLKFGCIADVTRVAGDSVLQIVRTL